MKLSLLSKILYIILPLPVLTLVLFEFFLIPWMEGRPRRVLLNGFATMDAMQDGTRISSLGFAGDVVERKKPPGVTRVLILGSSNVFLRDFADRLRIRLEQSFYRPFEVVGATGAGHYSSANLLKYQLFSDYEFDIVLIVNGFNDLRANHVAPQDFRWDFSHRSPYYRRNFILDHSLIARRLYVKYLYRRPKVVPEGVHYRSLDVYRENLHELISEVKAQDSLPVIVQSPWYLPKDYTNKKFHEGFYGFVNPENYVMCSAEVWGRLSYVKEGISRIRAIENDLADQDHVPILDLAVLMNEDVTHFADVFHFSDQGMSKAILNIIHFIKGHHFIKPVTRRWRTQPPEEVPGSF